MSLDCSLPADTLGSTCWAHRVEPRLATPTAGARVPSWKVPTAAVPTAAVPTAGRQPEAPVAVPSTCEQPVKPFAADPAAERRSKASSPSASYASAPACSGAATAARAAKELHIGDLARALPPSYRKAPAVAAADDFEARFMANDSVAKRLLLTLDANPSRASDTAFRATFRKQQLAGLVTPHRAKGARKR